MLYCSWICHERLSRWLDLINEKCWIGKWLKIENLNLKKKKQKNKKKKEGK